MLAKLLKPVRELFNTFRKQNTIVKILCIITILIVSRTIVERLTWGLFSEKYVENFGTRCLKLHLLEPLVLRWFSVI